MIMRPERLGDNRVPIYYAGGANIDDFRGAAGPHNGPEDWVGSLRALPPAFLGTEHPPDTGLSRLGDGSSLRDRVASDPDGWLGSELSARFAGDTGLLVKLLDAGQRLPVHCHPTREFARRHLGSFFGKTEGWIIMRADPGAELWLGLRDTIDRHEWTKWVTSQDAAAMLAAMNVVTAQAGQVVFVPAGLPHAIGPGVMLTELQEPTSFSVLAEHSAFGVSEDVATLGLGWDLALSCFDLRGRRDSLGELIAEPRPPGPRRSLQQRRDAPSQGTPSPSKMRRDQPRSRHHVEQIVSRRRSAAIGRRHDPSFQGPSTRLSRSADGDRATRHRSWRDK